MGVQAYRITALSFFGLGKLGLPLAALFARSGLRTVAIDTNARLIDRLTAGEAPYVEPGLAELLVAARPAIIYTTSARDAEGTDASIILVPTPSDPSAPDFSSAFVEQACRDLAAILICRALRSFMPTSRRDLAGSWRRPVRLSAA
jgi:UDP-N-acetyl-D-mannosaminuronate dehydrogenase